MGDTYRDYFFANVFHAAAKGLLDVEQLEALFLQPLHHRVLVPYVLGIVNGAKNMKLETNLSDAFVDALISGEIRSQLQAFIDTHRFNDTPNRLVLITNSRSLDINFDSVNYSPMMAQFLHNCR